LIKVTIKINHHARRGGHACNPSYLGIESRNIVVPSQPVPKVIKPAQQKYDTLFENN
jgi:hypothetical protein